MLHAAKWSFTLDAMWVNMSKFGVTHVSVSDDRVYAFGAGVECEWHGFEIHNSLTYADLGDGNLEQDGELAGRIKGSFDTNYAVVLDTQIIKWF